MILSARAAAVIWVSQSYVCGSACICLTREYNTVVMRMYVCATGLVIV
jgi:hypothetical protein